MPKRVLNKSYFCQGECRKHILYKRYFSIFSQNHQFYFSEREKNMNNITIIGRLAQDPTVGKSKSNGEPVTLFNIRRRRTYDR